MPLEREDEVLLSFREHIHPVILLRWPHTYITPSWQWGEFQMRERRHIAVLEGKLAELSVCMHCPEEAMLH